LSPEKFVDVYQVISPPPEEVLEYFDIDAEVDAFQRLLCAMYSLPYQVLTFAELERLTNTAEFYGALRIVSYTLSNALLDSPIFTPSTRGDEHGTEFIREAREILFLAKKLRHAVLFRDSFIVVVGIG
jgi:hypothetical protein